MKNGTGAMGLEGRPGPKVECIHTDTVHNHKGRVVVAHGSMLEHVRDRLARDRLRVG